MLKTHGNQHAREQAPWDLLDEEEELSADGLQ